MAHQLVFPFEVRAASGRGNFIVAPCNEQAVRFTDLWPDWPARAACFHGPQGSGKSHLATVWMNRSGAMAWSAASLDSATVAALPGGVPVLLEDVDAVAPSEARDRALLALLDRPAGATLMTGRASPSGWPVLIGDLRSRLTALLAFPLWAPDDTLLAHVARKAFADRQVQVPESVIHQVVNRLERTPAAVLGFIDRLDAAALARHRAITDRLVLDVLGGEG